jgi:hypothetical protein
MVLNRIGSPDAPRSHRTFNAENQPETNQGLTVSKRIKYLQIPVFQYVTKNKIKYSL